MGRAWTTRDEVRTERFDGIEHLKNPIGNSQIEIVQLGRGMLSGEILHGQIKDIAFSRGQFSLGVRATGVFSPAKTVVGILLACSGASRSLGAPVLPGDVLVHPPGAEHDRLYEGAARFAGVMCDPAEILNLFAAEQQVSDREFWTKRRHFRLSDRRTGELGALLALLAGRLHHGGIPSGAAADYWKRTILDAFVGPVAMEPGAGKERPIPSSTRIVHDAERYLKESGNRAVHVSEICRQIKVRRRTLYRAFNEALGIGPIEFLRTKRLSMVHVRLRQASPAETGVLDIASEFGFLEFGRFAQQYRALFGEYPSETLGRNASRKRPESQAAVPSDLARFA
ncbi:helix-turn-helix domain-containing protein [Bradyrhizobium sp. BR 10289]|uniref:helix-turn-helix domain-containing protein n=1 Tax=Bradyrhizobium sp. BR 10289 TaxID=2749993 RepID=UPI001C6495E4|nr:helix-turn-helix domain-containing protein [Bradyrhizobium sp. BR 10289]